MNSWNQWGVLLDQVALVDKTGAFISPGSPNSNSRKMKKQSQSKTQLAEMSSEKWDIEHLVFMARYLRIIIWLI